jgi:hypothetical protein
LVVYRAPEGGGVEQRPQCQQVGEVVPHTLPQYRGMVFRASLEFLSGETVLEVRDENPGDARKE